MYSMFFRKSTLEILQGMTVDIKGKSEWQWPDYEILGDQDMRWKIKKKERAFIEDVCHTQRLREKIVE